MEYSAGSGSQSAGKVFMNCCKRFLNSAEQVVAGLQATGAELCEEREEAMAVCRQ